ncbi:MAG: 6-bladed beta-propeller [Prolixibacteraceae bacterium]|nr:6-bladed beta-propeller [Prolixibacteraceae bacterium]
MKNSYHMPMKNCTLIFSILFFLFFSCQNNSKIENKIYSEYEVEIYNNEKSIDDLSFVRSAKLVFLENEHLIGNIKKLYIHDNKIYIWDNVADKILVFSTSGKYCFSVSDKGMGPNEYISITSFCYSRTNNNIFILDTKKRKVLCFSGQDGKFLYIEDIEHVPISIESDSEFLYFYNPFTFNYLNSDLKYS